MGFEELVFICAFNHELLNNGNVVNFNELIKYPSINREKDSGTRNIFEKQFPNHDQLDIKLESI
ncbi:MAG: hypothetical protein ACFFC3_14120 [Candidatus Odinarchaeota archaeon]